MKTGDIVRDDQGRAFQIGQLLGRGLWGKTFSVREEGGAEWVLKVPLSKADFPPGRDKLAEACQKILLEQGRYLTRTRNTSFIPIAHRFTTSDDIPVILLPRMEGNLERKLASGCTIEEVLKLCLRTIEALSRLHDDIDIHGNIHPANVLIDDRGELRLSDPITPGLRKLLPILKKLQPGENAYLPPELRVPTDRASDASVDTYAIAMILYHGIMASPDGTQRLPEMPLNGLDKARLVSLKDRVHNRLKEERSNTRFHTRLSDQTSALLNRALSRLTTPSPPYRFLDLSEFKDRMQRLHSLVNPHVEHIGKVLLDRPPGSNSYSTDEGIVFSCTIGCSPGVETYDEVACGVAVFNRDGDVRVRIPSPECTVDSHPSGRLRFGFTLTPLPPGSYLVRVAFTIRDSGDDPVVAESRFECRAAAGYVPPQREPEPPQPIPLQRKNTEDVITQSGVTSSNIGVEEPTPLHSSPRFNPVANTPLTAATTLVPPGEGDNSPADAPTPKLSIQPPQPVIKPRPEPPRIVPPRVHGFDQEPKYKGTGNWSELPLPDPSITSTGEDLYQQNNHQTDYDEDPVPGPVGETIARILALIRGDAYVMFIGGAAFLIILLIIVLLALR